LAQCFFATRKAEQGKEGGAPKRVPAAWLLLSLAVESPYLALAGPFLSPFVQMGLENGVLAM